MGLVVLSSVRGVLISRRRLDSVGTELNTRVAGSFGKGGLLILNVLGNYIFFVASLIHRVSLPLDVSFVSMSSCNDNARSANHIGVAGSVSVSLSNCSILVIRSVLSDNEALGCISRVLGAHNTGSVDVIALLSGPREQMTRVSPSCMNYSIPSRFIINCKLSCSRGCEGLPCVNTLGESICRGWLGVVVFSHYIIWGRWRNKVFYYLQYIVV